MRKKGVCFSVNQPTTRGGQIFSQGLNLLPPWPSLPLFTKLPSGVLLGNLGLRADALVRGFSLLVEIVVIRRDLSMCRRWDSNPHEVALTGFFESDKDCGMARDAALRGAFMGLFAALCGMMRVLVRPDRAERVDVLELSEAQLHDQQLSRKQPLVGSVNRANSPIRGN